MHTEVHIDISGPLEGFDAMSRKAVLGEAMKELKAPMKLDQKEHAKAKSGPDGAWPARAASTLASYAAHHRKPGKLLGRLPIAVSYRATLTSVIGESRVGWSQAHADGAIVGHGAKLPAREFLYISDKLMITAEEIIEKKIVAAYGGL